MNYSISHEPLRTRKFRFKAGWAQVTKGSERVIDMFCKAVIFDLDGVLVDSTASVEHAWQMWAQQHGLQVNDILAVMHGRRSIETMRLVAPHLATDREAEALNLFQAMDTSRDVMIPGALALLSTLPSQSWAVVTSGPPVLAHARLQAVGLPVPEVVVTSEDVTWGKPDPQGYLKAATQLGIPPEDCLVFEDAPVGIAAGQAAGMRVIAVATTSPLSALTLTALAVQTLADVQVKAVMASSKENGHPELALTISQPILLVVGEEHTRRKSMSIYTVVLFFHVIGAIGYFLGIGIWLFILLGLRRAQSVEHVRPLIHLNDLSAPFSAASAVLLLITGRYLALVAWSLLTSWILVALIGLLLMVPTSAALIAPRRSTIVKQLAREAPGGELSEALKRHIDDPILATVCTTVAALLLGLVFLMTTKPDLVGSLIVMVVALLLGLAAGVLVSRMRRAPEPGRVDQKAQDQEPVG